MEENKIDKEELVKQQILDAYFQFRSNLPQEGYVQQNRSTVEICDELNDMMYISIKDVAGYMADHDYAPTTEQDGSVKWAVWRMINT